MSLFIIWSGKENFLNIFIIIFNFWELRIQIN